jgi:ADP-L-glycero-D-manno-heptose 6-epimerase
LTIAKYQIRLFNKAIMIIITGGAGFIGSVVAWKCNREGRTDLIIVDELDTSEKWKNLQSIEYAQYVHKSQFLAKLLSGVWPHIDAIVHMGACSSTTETNMDFLMENNVEYTKTILNWCVSTGTRLVYASSAATYGNGEEGFNDNHDTIRNLKPINRYGYSKQLVDQFALTAGYLDKVVGLKFFNVYGPNEYHKGAMKSVVAKAYAQITKTGRLNLFKSHHPNYADGGQMRDFVYVKDCADIIWWLLQTPSVNGIYNVGTGRSRTWNDLAGAVFNAMSKPLAIEYIDIPDTIKSQYQYYTEASMQKLISAGYTTPMTSLETGIHEYVAHYLKTQNIELLLSN